MKCIDDSHIQSLLLGSQKRSIKYTDGNNNNNNNNLLSDEDPATLAIDLVPPTNAEREGATKASAPEKATAASKAKIDEQRIMFLCSFSSAPREVL